MDTPALLTPGGGRSLRSRWHRAFALLTAVVLLCGLTTLVGTRVLVDRFRGAAVRSEGQATTDAQLRSDLVVHAILFTNPISTSQQAQVGQIEAAIYADFARAMAAEGNPAARVLLATSLSTWEDLVAMGAPGGIPGDLATRGLAVTSREPTVLALLEEAGSTGRRAERADLARAALFDRRAMAVVALLVLVAMALAVRLARRLSREVLRPVEVLRDHANELAAGNLEHRVDLDRVELRRTDEFGQLAVSFNAMADAIAGTQRTLTRKANTDPLSGLANRAAFRVRLEAALARPERRAGSLAVLFVDLDDFKDVNDSLGHAAGDALLHVVAQRLSEVVRPGDLVARLGGDEFALLLDDLAQPDLAATVAERVVAAVAQPIDVGDTVVHVGVSVGLALRQTDSTFDLLMRQADMAMYAAKGKGKNRVESFDAGPDGVTVSLDPLRVDVGGAAQRGELVVEFQPVVDLTTGSLVGLEALVRWQHPTRGLLPPSLFIDLAERSGAIIGLGSWVLETATRQLRRWQSRYGVDELWVSVNVSALQLDGPGFVSGVERVLRSTGLDAASLVLEVTESVLVDPHGGAAAALTTLRSQGVRVALDDFGTGYSSIGYLRQLPVDMLKVDASFVTGTSVGSRDDTLLEAIVGMARHLGLDVIPEGIEQPGELQHLRAMGCHLGQGFLLSRPLSVDGVEALLAAPLPFPHIGLDGHIEVVDGHSRASST